MDKFQELTTKALPVPKKMWTVPVRFTAPESEKENILMDVKNVVSKFGPGVDNLEFNIVEVSGEWEGVKHVPHIKPKKTSYSQELFAELSRETEMGPVILYLHGGAYIAGSPDTHRELTLRLAEGCGGRVFSLKYRLSPQAQFPAALIDAVTAYKYLVDPPEGALHKAVNPAKIVIAGDSAGVYTI
jgi:hypothetical protein